jgi:hypothetical protein
MHYQISQLNLSIGRTRLLECNSDLYTKFFRSCVNRSCISHNFSTYAQLVANLSKNIIFYDPRQKYHCNHHSQLYYVIYIFLNLEKLPKNLQNLSELMDSHKHTPRSAHAYTTRGCWLMGQRSASL